MTKNQRLVYIALLAAQAVIISILERAIPFPFAIAPGAKIGLANIITCMALYTLSVRDAGKVVAHTSHTCSAIRWKSIILYV